MDSYQTLYRSTRLARKVHERSSREGEGEKSSERILNRCQFNAFFHLPDIIAESAAQGLNLARLALEAKKINFASSAIIFSFALLLISFF